MLTILTMVAMVGVVVEGLLCVDTTCGVCGVCGDVSGHGARAGDRRPEDSRRYQTQSQAVSCLLSLGYFVL